MEKQYDAIVILGGGRDNTGELTPLSTQRLDAGYDLYKKGLAPRIFALGGHKTTYSPYAIAFDKTGAELRRDYLVRLGAPVDAVVMVKDGKDTIGEAFASRKAAGELDLHSLLVVTSDKHIERSLFVFKRIFGRGYKIEGSEVPSGDLLNDAEEKEYLAVLRHFFETLPEDIPDPDPEKWHEEHAELYRQYKEIHDRYHPPGKESQAYMGVKKEW